MQIADPLLGKGDHRRQVDDLGVIRVVRDSLVLTRPPATEELVSADAHQLTCLLVEVLPLDGQAHRDARYADLSLEFSGERLVPPSELVHCRLDGAQVGAT